MSDLHQELLDALQKRYKCSTEVAESIAKFVEGGDYLSDGASDVLCDYHAADMPYGALTGDTSTPDEWLFEYLSEEYKWAYA